MTRFEPRTLEATPLPTEPQPLPEILLCSAENSCSASKLAFTTVLLTAVLITTMLLFTALTGPELTCPTFQPFVKHYFFLGHGQGVNVLAFYSNNPSLNLAEAYNFFL